MKEIVDALTGEIVEVEDRNEIMVRRLYELGTDLESYAELESQFDYIKEQIETWKYLNRENIKSVLDENKQKSVKVGKYTFTVVPEAKVPKLDVEWLKADGQYDNHLKLSYRKSYLKISKGRE